MFRRQPTKSELGGSRQQEIPRLRVRAPLGMTGDGEPLIPKHTRHPEQRRGISRSVGRSATKQRHVVARHNTMAGV
jgi:hypothetical protein